MSHFNLGKALKLLVHNWICFAVRCRSPAFSMFATFTKQEQSYLDGNAIYDVNLGA